MRVRIYKDEEGNLSALVEPSPGKGRPPVLLNGVTSENVSAQIGPIIVAMRRPKGEKDD